MTETDVGRARWMGMGRTEGSARRGGQKKRQGSTIEPNFLPIVNERADIQKRQVGPVHLWGFSECCGTSRGTSGLPVPCFQLNLVGDRGLCAAGAGALSQTRSRHPARIRIVEGCGLHTDRTSRGAREAETGWQRSIRKIIGSTSVGCIPGSFCIWCGSHRRRRQRDRRKSTSPSHRWRVANSRRRGYCVRLWSRGEGVPGPGHLEACCICKSGSTARKNGRDSSRDTA